MSFIERQTQSQYVRLNQSKSLKQSQSISNSLKLAILSSRAHKNTKPSPSLCLLFTMPYGKDHMLFIIILSITPMQYKLQRIKMVTLYNKISSTDQTQSRERRQSASIHAEMSLLKNLIRKNQVSTHNIPNSFFTCVESTDQLAKKHSKNGLNHTTHQHSSRRSFLHDSARQEKLGSQMIASKLLEICSFSKLRTMSEQGNRSQRLQRTYNHQNSNFIPLGKIYNQLRYKTERTIESDLKAQLDPSLILKDKVEEKKKFSIYAKQTNSIQRKALRQQNKIARQSFELGPMADLMIKESIQVPSPW